MLLHQPYDSEASKDPQDVRQQAWPAGDRIAVIAGATSAFFGALNDFNSIRLDSRHRTALRWVGALRGLDASSTSRVARVGGCKVVYRPSKAQPTRG